MDDAAALWQITRVCLLEITKDILAQETFRILLRKKLWIVSIKINENNKGLPIAKHNTYKL